MLAQFEYWAKHPPIHLLVAALAGVKSTTDEVDPRAKGKDWSGEFFQPKSAKKIKTWMKPNPERERRFAVLEAWKKEQGYGRPN